MMTDGLRLSGRVIITKALAARSLDPDGHRVGYRLRASLGVGPADVSSKCKKQ